MKLWKIGLAGQDRPRAELNTETRTDRLLAVRVLALVLLVAVNAWGGRTVWQAVREGQAAAAKRVEMERAVADYARLRQSPAVRELEQEAQPVTWNRVEELQSAIIRKVKQHGLRLISLSLPQSDARLAAAAEPAGGAAPPADAKADKAKPAKADKAKPSDGLEFELTVTGAWDKTILLLENIKEPSLLMAVKSLRMEPQQDAGDLQTTIKYKYFMLHP